MTDPALLAFADRIAPPAREWHRVRRAKQAPPTGDWSTWLILAGRGWGKTRTGAEWVQDQVEAGRRRIALVARTAADYRAVMVEGESGLLAIAPASLRPVYEPSKRQLTWPNGAIATLYSSEKPDQLRGPQHDAAWADELAAWSRPKETWDQLMFGLRLGDDPRCVVTTTPRPTPEVRELVAEDGTVITRGATFENEDNLAAKQLDRLRARYEGTRLGRQELYGEILDDTEGALWTRAMLERAVLGCPDPLPSLTRVVVAVDPAVTSGEDSDETGIVVVGRDAAGHGYVLADRSGRYGVGEWEREVIRAHDDHDADLVVAEVNNGGDFIGHAIRNVRPTIRYRAVRATRGKAVRAEPVAGLYELDRMHHTAVMPELEDQMATWVPDSRESPDRLDALVWGATALELFRGEARARTHRTTWR